MNKPRWVGEETPDIAAIRAGRAWGELDVESWQRIEAIVAARPESVRLAEADIHGTRRQVHKLRGRALWETRRKAADDPASGIIEWSGRDHEPERPQLVGDRSPGSYHLTSESDQVTTLGEVEVRIVPPPRRRPSGRRPGPEPGSMVAYDLGRPDHRARFTLAWERTADHRRRVEAIAADLGIGVTALGDTFARAGCDRGRFLKTGEIVQVRPESLGS